MIQDPIKTRLKFIHFIAMKKYVVFLLFIFSIKANSQTSVYPTHWWAGMKDPFLQLMIHNESDLGKQVTVDGKGISILKIYQPENKHYLFIDLQISTLAKPGIYTISISSGEKIKYELKSRSNKAALKLNQGVNASDLVYLIMPDRFSNGDPSNDQYEELRDKDSDRNNPYVRHGGDLAGITDKLDYLNDIGATALWLTPVLENNTPKMQEGPFTMSGYHGYWITDHYKVDKRLGGAEAYKKMISSAHNKGIKVIQDAVYNHVSIYHNTVLDLPMKEWLNQWPSYQGTHHREEVFMDPYATKSEQKIMTEGWFVPHLADLNLANSYCANFILQNTVWNTEEYGIDGWRVDTYKYCDEKFLNRVNNRLYKEFPTLTMFGEAVANSVPASAYFAENNLVVPFKHNAQGIIDFPLNAAIMNSLNQRYGWTEGVSRLYMTLSQDFLYKDPMRNSIFLDNHDSNRFFSMIGEDIRKYKMGVGLLLTLRGIPQVYYGIENLTKNFMDPNDAAVRKDFPGGWINDTINKFKAQNLNAKEKEAFDYFKKIANFRKSSLAIAKGTLKQYIPQNGVYVYFRMHNNQVLMCVLNTNENDTALKFDRFQEVLNGHSFMYDIVNDKNIPMASSINLPSMSFQLYELKIK